MEAASNSPHIQLHDFRIVSPLPLPKLLLHPSRLALKFSVDDGVDRKELLSIPGDIEGGMWEIDGDVEIPCDGRQLTATITVYSEDSTKELGVANISNPQLLVQAKARPRECFEFTFRSSVLLLVTCYIRTLSSPRKQHTKHVFSPMKIKPDKGQSNRNRALTSNTSSTDSIADLELYYTLVTSLPTKGTAQILNDIGCKYGTLYEETHRMVYLERAISILGEALENASLHPRRPEYLFNFATYLLKRFERTGSRNDIDEAVSKSRDAVHTAERNDINMHRYVLNHAVSLLTRFEHLEKLEDLQSSISCMNEAIKLMPDGHPNKPNVLSTLGEAFQIQFQRLGHIEDLETAILHHQNAVDTMPDGHPKKPAYLNDLANAVETRYERLGHIEDLEAATLHKRNTVDSTPDGHSYKPAYVNNLGGAFQTRFERLDHLEDLEAAILHHQSAVDSTPDGHPRKPGYLNNLGIAFMKRFERLGRLEDLEIAILHFQNAADSTLDGRPNEPGRLNNLGNAFRTRFNRLGRLEDLEAALLHYQNAVDMTPDGHPDKPDYLNNLGSFFKTRFNQLGHVEDPTTAILHNQKAVDLTPDGHPEKPNRLNNLGNAFETRFNQLGNLEDLEVAIFHHQNAVDSTPNGHPRKVGYLTNLGNAFETRFYRLGHMKDLETAILHRQKAVDMTPNGHPDKPRHLNNLGIAFQTRFERLDHVKDLEVAILHSQNALDLMPDGHPDKPGLLSNLGGAFHTRFQRSGRVEDLTAAILHSQNAVDSMPDGHSDKSICLTNLGITFEARFNRLGNVEDLEAAILHNKKAVDSTPDGHPNKPLRLEMLARTFIYRFILLEQPQDLHAAHKLSSTAASQPAGSPRDRLKAVKTWALVLETLEEIGEPISHPLEPYYIAIDLLPRVAWLGTPITTQHALLEVAGGTVRDAVSAAIRLGEYEASVAWMEAGRSITWQNLLHLRTPVDELRSAHEELANRLETISGQLDMSVRESNGRMEKATSSGVQLALEWDNTVAEIRSKPGFESFLRPKGFGELGRIACDGPVVILNANESRCDALLMIPEENGGVYLSSISLNAFSYEKSQDLLKELKQLLRSRNLRESDIRPMKRRPPGRKTNLNLHSILRCIWIDVVKPIIEALAYQPRPIDLPHIWWCATGPLAFLPIHAAGIYDTDEPGNKLSDYVVSSYTPTLSALMDDTTSIQEDFKLMMVAQANAPGAAKIPNTVVEVERIRKLGTNVNITTLVNEDATVENVWHGMEESSWVHLACHGQQNIEEPMKSGLLLHDGTLGLQRLIEKPLPHAEFAFLSACQTATGDESVAEESLHLAAGMLFAGYKGVIATMWSIKDEVGPQVAEDVYRVMLKDGKPNRKAAAHALHEAVRRLREDPTVEMVHWVPFIHIGR